MYTCPDCRTPLTNLRCATCSRTFDSSNGIPILLSSSAELQPAAEIGAVYDDIYTHRTAVWENQGRTDDFIQYFADLVGRYEPRRLLEIGCGEGLLLARLPVADKTAIDLSSRALARARSATGAECSVALAERLPFPDASFDLVTSVGVMEHFLDEDLASREIARVLKPGGHYLVLIHVALTRSQELAQKVREYVFPVPRPVGLARWLFGKVYRPIRQPIQKRFTTASGQSCLERNGLAVERIISTATVPDAPLIGPHVVLYVTRKV